MDADQATPANLPTARAAALRIARPVARGPFGLSSSRGRAAAEIAAVAVVLTLWPVLLAVVVHLPQAVETVAATFGRPAPVAVMDWARSVAEAVERHALWVNVGASAAIVVVLLAVITQVAGHGVAQLGLRGRGWPAELGVGVAAVVPAYALTAAVSMVVAATAAAVSESSIERMIADKQVMIEAVGQVSPWSILPLALLVGVYEELLFRGFLLGRLAVLFRRAWVAAVVSTVLFGLAHVPSQGWVGFVQTGMLGGMLAALTLWRRNIWPAIACHAGIDTIGFVLTLAIQAYAPEVLTPPSGVVR